MGSLLGSWMADRFGRRPGIAVLALSWATFGVCYAYAGSNAALMAVGFGVMVSAYGVVAVGYSIYIPELFPTELRLRGAGLAGAAGRLAAAGAQYAVVWAFGFGGVGAVSAGMAALLVILALVIVFAGVETRQRSLEALASSVGEQPQEPVNGFRPVSENS